MSTNSTCLRAWRHNVAPTPSGSACTKGEHGSPRNTLHPLALRMMMHDSGMPNASVRKGVGLSRVLLILSFGAFLAAFGGRNADDPAHRHPTAAVRTGNTNTGSSAVTPSGSSSHSRSSAILGVEAADAHSGKKQQSYAAATMKGNHSWEDARAVYEDQYTPHVNDDHRSVPSHLIMRAAVEEALSTLEDVSHGVAHSRNVEHSPSTTHEAETNALSYESVAHEPPEESSRAGVYARGGLAGDDTVERGSHDSLLQWPEEHVETHEDIEQAEVPGNSMHRVRRRHRVYGGSKPKIPAEAFNQYDPLLTVFDRPESPEKEVSVDGDVLEAVAEPMMPSTDAELGWGSIAGPKRHARVLSLQPIAVMLVAVLIAVALMLAQSQSESAKDILRQTSLPGRREDRRGYAPHLIANDRAENRYFERGYIAEPGEDGAGQQVAWMQADDETTAAPYDNDSGTRGIEQQVIRLMKDLSPKVQTAYGAEQTHSTDDLGEPFAVPAGGAAETMYKDKGEYHDIVLTSSHGALQALKSDDDESSAHHK